MEPSKLGFGDTAFTNETVLYQVCANGSRRTSQYQQSRNRTLLIWTPNGNFQRWKTCNDMESINRLEENNN